MTAAPTTLDVLSRCVLDAPPAALAMHNDDMVPVTAPGLVHRPGSTCVWLAENAGRLVKEATIADALYSDSWCVCWRRSR